MVLSRLVQLLTASLTMHNETREFCSAYVTRALENTVDEAPGFRHRLTGASQCSCPEAAQFERLCGTVLVLKEYEKEKRGLRNFKFTRRCFNLVLGIGVHYVHFRVVRLCIFYRFYVCHYSDIGCSSDLNTFYS